MFYEEKIIGGILCYRYSPNQPWFKMTPEIMTKRLIEEINKKDNDN